MASKLFAHLRRQWIGVLALFLVLTGGTAIAGDGAIVSLDGITFRCGPSGKNGCP